MLIFVDGFVFDLQFCPWLLDEPAEVLFLVNLAGPVSDEVPSELSPAPLCPMVICLVDTIFPKLNFAFKSLQLYGHEKEIFS